MVVSNAAGISGRALATAVTAWCVETGRVRTDLDDDERQNASIVGGRAVRAGAQGWCGGALCCLNETTQLYQLD